MTPKDGLDCLGQFDLLGIFALFWYTLGFEVPRYVLAVLAVALTRLRPATALTVEWRPSGLVSIVVAGHNEARSIGALLKSLGEQTLRSKVEVICVNDGSTDGMGAELRRLRAAGLIDVALSNNVRCGKSAACNLAFEWAKGEILINVDADCSFDRDAIERILAPFADPTVGAVTGNIGVRNSGASFIAGLQAVEYLHSISVGKETQELIHMITCVSGPFSAFRAEALRQVGGMDAGPGEDLDLTLRLRLGGWKIAFAEDAWCMTDVPETLMALTRQRMRWERDAARIRLRKFGATLLPFHERSTWLEYLQQMDFVIGNFLTTILFPVYLAWLFFTFGTWAFAVLMMVLLFYVPLNLLLFALAAFTVPRLDVRNLWICALASGLFNAAIMRPIRCYAYLEELIFDRSYHDAFTPRRVHSARPRF